MEIIKVEHLKVGQNALLEIRSFDKAIAKKFIFIKSSHIKEIFKSNFQQLDCLTRFEKPTSISDSSDYFNLFEIKELVNGEDFNRFLVDLFLEATNYEQINVIFPFISEIKDFNEEQIKVILLHSLYHFAVKKSFEAQRLMLNLVFWNKKNIQEDLFDKILKEFPHSVKNGQILST